MKKFFKPFLSAVLAFVMIFGSITAFATENAKSINWYYSEEECEYYDTYAYAGEFKEGTNTLTYPEDEYFLYCSFAAEKDGYYSIKTDDYFYPHKPESFKNNSAYGFGEEIHLYSEETELTESIYYFNQGETVIGFDCWSSEATETEVEIEYIGDSITNLSFEDNFENLIIGADIYNTSDENTVEVYADASVTFSSGKEIRLEDWWFTGKTTEELKSGINTITFELFDCKLPVEIACKNISDYVINVEFDNADRYTYLKKYYSGCDIHLVGGNVSLTLSDGTVQTVEISPHESFYVTLPNGRNYWVGADYSFGEGDSYAIYVNINRLEVKTYDCIVEKASLAENIGRLSDRTTRYFKNSFYCLRKALATLISFYDFGDMKDHFYKVRWDLEESANSLSDMFNEINRFIDYYI